MADRFDTFHVMTKPTGSICNLDCTYCFYLEKEALYPERNKWAMPEEVLERYIEQYIAAQHGEEVNFAWQGGEPTLLGVDYFRKIVALQQKHAQGKKIFNALQTNGTLLDDEWCVFLRENQFLVGISIDGPRAIHDQYRVDKGGKPTFDRVMRGLERLKANRVEFNTLTCVQRRNAHHPLEVYRFLKEIGSGFMQFIPIVERLAPTPGPDGLSLIPPASTLDAPVSEWSVDSLQYGKFLTAISDEWVRYAVGRDYLQISEAALATWLGHESPLCVFAKTCGTGLALEHNGDLYSCDHFVYPEYRLGNIMDEPLASLARNDAQRAFGNAKLDTLPKYCKSCEVRFACNGECPKHRFMHTPDGEPGLNYLCAGYKHFFTHIDPYMQFMATQLRNGRAPALIMSQLRTQDRVAAGKSSDGPNAPCSCGSGRKYKKCCGARLAN